MPNKVRYILDDEITWLMRAQNLDDIVEQVAPLGALKALLAARLREGLAGKPCAEDIVIWNRRYVERSDVTVRAKTEIFLVKVRQIFVDLASKDALVTESS